MTGDIAPIKVADTRCHTGEGPLWHPDESVVYWADIPRGVLYRYDPTNDDYERTLEVDGAIGGFTIQENGELLLFMDGGTVRSWSDSDGVSEPVIDGIPEERDSRFNDVIADPEGRVYAGTMPTADRGGRLYRIETDGSWVVVMDDLAIPNGLGFSPDRRFMYVTETLADRIYRFRYDQDTGDLSNRETFLDLREVDGHPDGMTVDAPGDLWVAFWDGSRIARYDATGHERDRIPVPARKTSSITFGGPEYETAYVTTALGPGEGALGTRDQEGTGAGALFRLDPGVPGRPEFRSRIHRSS